MARAQQSRIKWPLTPHQVEAVDDMLETLFKRLRKLEDGVVGTAISGPTIINASGVMGPPGIDGESGEDGVPGTAGAAGAPGPTGATGPASPNGVESDVAGVTVDAGVGQITVGQKGYRRIWRTGTIVGWTILASGTGSVTFDITKDVFGAFPPVTSIVAASPPILTSGTHSADTTLAGWTTSVDAGDVLGFTVTSTIGISRVTLELQIAVTGVVGIPGVQGVPGDTTEIITQTFSLDPVHSGFYDTGLWTPTVISAGGGTPTYTTQYGSFVRIGDLVLATYDIVLATFGTLAAGAITIGGLPYPVTAGATFIGGSTQLMTFSALTNNFITLHSVPVVSSSTLAVRGIGAAGTANATAITKADLSGTSTLAGSGLYMRG